MSGKALFIDFYLPELLRVAREAGAIIMRHYKAPHTIGKKSDNSPVTAADQAANDYIVNHVKALDLPFPIVSEEGEQHLPKDATEFWLIDPLDGTRSFIRGQGDFTVNIAWINAEHIPALGIIYAPLEDTLYWGCAEGAFRQQAALTPVKLHSSASRPLRAIVSHHHVNHATEAWLSAEKIATRIPCASSIKFCRLAEGAADVYPRFGPTMEWDTAAGHAILTAAGGSVRTPNGSPFLYGKPNFANGPFIARA